jgi:hypothetical protein
MIKIVNIYFFFYQKEGLTANPRCVAIDQTHLKGLSGERNYLFSRAKTQKINIDYGFQRLDGWR